MKTCHYLNLYCYLNLYAWRNCSKLSGWFFEKEEQIVPLFEQQLEICGVDYFDFYLFHALDYELYMKHKRCNSFEIVNGFKKEGRVKHIAMSFHDSAEVLDMILTEQPCIEAVQLQFNYLDFDDPNVQSKACYDVAVKHGKKVLVMEPVKGGLLAEPSQPVRDIIAEGLVINGIKDKESKLKAELSDNISREDRKAMKKQGIKAKDSAAVAA